MTVPRVVVVDHYDSYTWNLVHLVAEVAGVLPHVVEHDAIDAATALAYSHIVLSPGPGHPADPRDFTVGAEILRAATIPVLGVCLGMQGLVTTFGGVVARARPAHGEVAEVSHDGRGVFRGVPQGFRAVRYHSLVAARVPPELVVTATCRRTGEDPVVMGVRHRDRPLEGVQFHPESILSEHGSCLVANFLGVSR